QDDLSPVSLPEPRLAKQNDTIRRQPGLADPPAAQLSRIINRASKGHGWRGDAAGRASGEYAQGDLGTLPAENLGLHQRPTDNATAHLIVADAEDRRRGNFAELVERPILRIGYAGSVFRKQGVEDRGLLRHGRAVCQHLAECQIVEPGNLY